MTYDNKEVMYSFKIVICGTSSVGKTSLFNRYCFNSFDLDTSPTIGINFHSIHLKINYENNINEINENYIINSIFDFGGQERFKALLPKFIEGANGALLVFDLVNEFSFNQLDFWYNQIINYAVRTDIPIILVGSKSDLLDKTPTSKIIADKKIKDYVKEKQLDGFFKTSSLENYNVLKVFKELNNKMLKEFEIPYVVV
ncbi:MAG: Rab family GTPase [Promethearchaeota archaeon]